MADEFEGPGVGGLLQSAVIASPLAVGVGIGVRDVLNKGGLPNPGPSTSSYAAASKRIRATIPPVPSLENHMSFMNSLTGNLGTINDPKADPAVARALRLEKETIGHQAKEAWQLAYGQMDPLLRKGLPQAGDIMSKGNVEALQEIHAMVRGVTGTSREKSMHKMMSKFRRNFGILSESQRLTGGLPTFMGNQSAINASAAAGNTSMTIPSPRLLSSNAGMNAFKGMGYSQNYWAARGGKGGHTTFNVSSKGGMFEFNMPQVFGQKPGSLGGFMYEGRTGATLKAAPSVRIFDEALGGFTELSRSDFLLREFEQSILPRIQSDNLSGPALQKEVSSLYRDIIQSQENLQTSTGAYANMRRGDVDIMVQSTAKEMSKAQNRGEGITSVRPATESERATIMARNQDLRGGTSPKSISKSRLSTKDVSKLSMTPQALDWASRPEQSIREWKPSMSSIQDKHFQLYDTDYAKEMFGKNAKPRARTLYVNPDQHLAWLRDVAMIGDGEAMASTDAVQLQSWHRENSMRVQANRSRADLLKLWHSGELKAGMALGADMNTGDLQTLSENMQVSDISLHQTKSGDEFFKLNYTETIKTPAHAKFFDSLKATMHFQTPEKIQGKMQSLGLRRDMIDAGYTVIADMDRLKKSRSLHNEQLTSGLHDAMMEKFGKKQHINKYVAGFMKDPIAFTQGLADSATVDGVYGEAGHKKTVTGLAKVAQQSGLSPGRVGEVFGSLPYTMGKRTSQKIMRDAGWNPNQLAGISRSMSSGVAGGVGSFAYAGPGYDTMGSVEPRAFLALQGGSLGQFGEEMASDISQRLALTNPEKSAISAEIGQTLSSLTGETISTERTLDLTSSNTDDISSSFKKFVDAGGGTMKFGHGVNDMYVPGAEAISSMRSFTTASGKEVYSDLFGVYENAARQGTLLNVQGGINSSEFAGQLDKTIGDLQYHHAVAGKGLGAVERGKVLGSRFLMGVTEPDQGWVGKAPDDIYTAGISKKYSDQMFDEMNQSGLYENQELKSMQTKFNRGERVGGFMSRHPFIGAYSHQPIGLQMIRGDEAVVSIPEKVFNLRGRDLTLGSLLGMAGDKDADHFSVMMLSPRHEAHARRALQEADEGFINGYMNHQVRMGLLKPQKAMTKDMTTLQELIGGTMKLGTTQSYIPQLSVELTKARAAIGGMAGQAKVNAQTLLEWLEQTPISAKHLSTQDVLDEKLSGTLKGIVNAFQDTNEEGLRYAIDQMVGSGKSAQSSLDILGKGINLTDTELQGLRDSGLKGIQQHIPGIDADKTISEMMESIRSFSGTPAGREFELMTGRGKGFGIKELPEYLASLSGKAPKGAMFASVSSAAIAGDNMLSRVGAGLANAAPKLGLGFAASIALSSILSTPSSSVGSGVEMKANVNRNQGKAGNRIKPEDLHPPSRRLGEPTAPSMLHPTRVLLASPGQSPQVDIRARGSSIVNGSDLSSRIRQAVGGRSNVNMNIRDDSSNLNLHAFGNTMF